MHWFVRMKNKDNQKKRTCIRLNALEFVFVHIREEWISGPVSGAVAALSHVACLSLDTKTNIRMVA